MNVARLNFSHGSHEQHRAVYQDLRRLAEKVGRRIAILQDLPGPKMRCGSIKEGVVLKEGQAFSLIVGEGLGDETQAYTTFEALARDVRPGEKILIDDGKLVLRAREIDGLTVHCEVLVGGELRSRKGINLPESSLSIPSFTEEDRQHLMFGLELGVDMVALSFVRDARDILRLRKAIAATGRQVMVIAKIEKPEAIANLSAILDNSDGVMVARGDLAVEMSTEEVPILQKKVIEEANRRGKVVITATQMLESMTEGTMPTRAEASDVANAVFDGTDALMLSAESASGRYPIQSVEMMSRIIQAAERASHARAARPPDLIEDSKPFRNLIAKAAVMMATSLQARAIITFTYTGTTARLISHYRPLPEIIAFTPSPTVANRMVSYWGTTPFVWESELGVLEEMIPTMDAFLTRYHLAEAEDTIVIASENTLRLHRVGTPYYDDSNRSYDNLLALL
jgi:pyruvate kinase